MIFRESSKIIANVNLDGVTEETCMDETDGDRLAGNGVTLEFRKAELEEFRRLVVEPPGRREARLAAISAAASGLADRLRMLLDAVAEELEVRDYEGADPNLGRSVGGWRLERLLGRGASARVYLGAGEGSPPEVALKLFDRSDLGPGFRRRLAREIEALRRIDHPGVVHFVAEGVDEASGRPWLAMEFVPDAMGIIDRVTASAATLEERIGLIRQMRSALAAAHAAGVVHRDLSPRNVLVDGAGRVKIVDFGIASVVHESLATHGTVAATVIAGTPATMAPEQVDRTFGPIGSWTDEYAAAAIAYRLLAGRYPYDTTGSLASVAQAIVHVPPRPLRELEPEVPPEIAAWVDGGLVKGVRVRQEALASVGNPAGLGSPAGGRNGVRKRTTWVAVAALIALVAWFAVDFGQSGRAGVFPAVEGHEQDEQKEESMNMRDTSAAAAIALTVGTAAMQANGVDRLVPEQYSTIAAAFSASSGGDVISVAPGTYQVGLLTMPSFPVVLKGRGAPSQTVLTGQEIRISAGNGIRSVQSLTLEGFVGYGAIRVVQATAAIHSVRFVNNGSHGIFLESNATATTIDCEFIGNLRGGYAFVNSTWNAQDCLFEANANTDTYGGGAAFHVNSGGTFLRCRFVGNQALKGGAIGLSFPGTRVFDQCYFEGNSSPNGDVWWTEDSASGTLKNSTLCGHSPADVLGSWVDGGGNEFFPDGCYPPCPGDVDGSGAVNAVDISVVLGSWGTSGGKYPGADVDGSGTVDAADLSAVLAGWGSCPTSVLAWGSILQADPSPSVVTDAALRDAIQKTGLPWRVRHRGSGIEMLLVPPGTFIMGCSPSNEDACLSDESPAHSVTITQAFYLGRYEVRQSEWQRVMGSNPSVFQGAGFPNSANRPVDTVSWASIQPFLTSTGLRLPSEAEWEYAYRAGTTTAFHNNTSDVGQLASIAWFDANAGGQTHPVGLKAPNALGFHDMSGNVREWLGDFYSPTYYQVSPAVDPQGPMSGKGRVLRGGSLSYGANTCRASVRLANLPKYADGDRGFRVSMTP
jgi:formylglycine-generating enzyme required for sulfatase activity/serine/threonine protein kinase